MKKKLEGRTVPLHPEAKEAIKAWIKHLQQLMDVTPNMPLFVGQKGKAIDRRWCWRILNQTFRQNDMSGKLGTHSMRKTFANKVYEKLNRDLLKTQKAMGHKEVDSTVSYLSFKQEEIDQAILDL